ncbi:MAG: Bug family tripartite tricarboxylate transporter substrate binding protein, partial [Xanthobacteraceae bacterium]
MTDALRMLVGAAFATGLAAIDGHAQPAAYPDHPVKMLVGFAAGGGTDVAARILAQKLTETLGQSVVVENRPGGSGIIGSIAVARADPDGYLLVLGTNQTHAANQSLLKNHPFDAAKDFTAVSGLAEVPHVLVVRKDLALNNLAVKDVAELVALAKQKPGGLNCGSSGVGSASHLTMELFKTRADVAMLHVPFRGSAPLLTELLAGRIDVSFATLPTVAAQVDNGDVKALAIASTRRTPRLPAVPTLSEAGITGVEADAWFALFAPAGTPRPILERINKELAAALKDPVVRHSFEINGA